MLCVKMTRHPQFGLPCSVQISEERLEFLKSHHILDLFVSPIIFDKSYKRTRRTKASPKRKSQSTLDPLEPRFL